MIQTVPLTADEWTQVGVGPHTVFWALGHLRFFMGPTPPTNEYDSFTLAAQGQVKSFAYNGTDPVWVRSVGRNVTIQAVQVTSSELFLVDAAGNVVLDALGGGVI